MGATNQIKDVSVVEFVLRKRHVWLLPTGLDFGAKTKKKTAMNVFEEEAKPQKNQQKDNSSESEKVPESKREVRCVMRQVKSKLKPCHLQKIEIDPKPSAECVVSDRQFSNIVRLFKRDKKTF